MGRGAFAHGDTVAQRASCYGITAVTIRPLPVKSDADARRYLNRMAFDFDQVLDPVHEPFAHVQGERMR
jgi:hypothetical protein